MGQTHLIIPDSHAHFQYNNNRAVWLGELIKDVRPEVVVNLGDTADMPSLAGYDKGKRCFQGRTYRKDVDAHNDFQEKLWSGVRKAKKKMPRRITLIGNHEQRIHRAIELQPELEGAIGYDDLELERWYDTVVDYDGNTPDVYELDGIHYAHYFTSGIMGRPIGGEHPAYSLLAKKFTSCTAGHQHVIDYSVRTNAYGNKIMGLVAGCYMDFDMPWAGDTRKLWWSGVAICNNVEDGRYDLELVSIEELKKLYGNVTGD